MARRSQADKAESRRKILEATAGLIREQGIEGSSVTEIMEQAGMTHGGFYRHFDSKEDLVAEAIAVAFKAGLDTFEDGHAGTAEEAEAYISQYLSRRHVEEPAGGCPIPLLGAEIARGSEVGRAALAKGILQASQKLSEGLNDHSKSDALLILSTLVGTLVLARGVGEGELQDEILQATSDHMRDRTTSSSIS